MFKRLTVAAALVASVCAVGATASVAGAAPAGFTPVETCTQFTGTISFSPGLLNAKSRNTTMIVNGTIGGCSGQNGSQSGTGTFFATLSGGATCGSIQLMGDFNINWPSSSGLNPTSGMVTISGSGANAGSRYNVSGSDTGGAYASGIMNSQYVVTGKKGTCKAGHPLKSQTFTNSAPLQIEENFG